MKELMTAVLAVCPKVRGSASELRQVDLRSRHCAQCPPQPYRRNEQEEARSRTYPFASVVLVWAALASSASVLVMAGLFLLGQPRATRRRRPVRGQ